MLKKITILILLMLVTTFSFANQFVVAESEDVTDFQKTLLIHHRPIYIEGNNGFTAGNGVTGGDGTPESPYIISDWVISLAAGYGIRVCNTDVYFVIENCCISGNEILSSIGISPIGIYFNNVTNGRIVNCTCINCEFGILLISSSNNTVEGCCCENDAHGISINGCPCGYTTSSDNNIIKNCTFSNCENGVYFCCLPGSSNNLIEGCLVSNNRRGVVLDHCIHYTLIVGCNISDNTEVGVEIISASSHNYISNNIFWKNKEHARDNCKNIWDNGPIFGGNYWEGHNTSTPYEIPGVGNSRDLYPLEKELKQKPFIAFFSSSPHLPLLGQEVCFDATPSYIPMKTVSYEWDFGDGTHGNGCTVKHVYSKEGRYNVTLKVANETVNDTFTQLIHVVKLTQGAIHVPDVTATIQKAIDSAKPGYTIYVENGTYYENIAVDVPYLTVVGSGYRTTIDGRKKGDVVYITAPFVTITNFTIRNSSLGRAGVQLGKPDYIVDALGCYIKNNQISGNSIGINMSETECNSVERNVVTENLVGIHSIRSYNNTFTFNRVFLNNIGFLFEYGSNWNKITSNAVTANDIGLELQWSHYNIITRNDIIVNRIGLNLTNAISPKINYNNIYKNQEYGMFFTSMLPNARYNWWGSKLGPSWFLQVFGDRVWMGEIKILKLRGIGIRCICFPWQKKPVKIIS